MADHPSPLAGLLGPDDPAPVKAENSGARSGFFLVCDHAGRATPARLERLGLPEAAFETHIAWDIGALDLARRLGEALDAPLIHQAYSRLVIDCNRAPGHPQSIADVSDGWEIPGNQALPAAAAEARRVAIHAPYHAAISAALEERARAGMPTLLVCVHSFTPSLGGASRPWHVGVLHGGASPASDQLITALRAADDLVVGDNEPYAMDGTDYTAPHHAWSRGLDVIELEVRQDLLIDIQSARNMSSRLAEALSEISPVGEAPGAPRATMRLK
jgi:predicted N-formylglutamate amidohydrolase